MQPLRYANRKRCMRLSVYLLQKNWKCTVMGTIMNGHAFLRRMYLRPGTMTKGGGLYLKRRRAISSLTRRPGCSHDQQPLARGRVQSFETLENSSIECFEFLFVISVDLVKHSTWKWVFLITKSLYTIISINSICNLNHWNIFYR